MFKEHDRVIASQSMFHKSLCIVGVGRYNDTQSWNLSVHRIIAARMMSRRRVADTDTTAQQDRHFQTAARHVLHLSNLVYDLADRIEDEVGKHEIDDGSCSCHRGTARKAHETAFRDWRIAQSFWTVKVV